MQENKPVLELKNTEKKMCQKSKLKKQNSQCTLMLGTGKFGNMEFEELESEWFQMYPGTF